ncbi:DivIVA domain-containing protein [Hathewaya limosa]|uniref:Cell division initiation protein n=1 Tax=Hathewaya limosa TaxID=1536 RepID=A0ABU0JUY3_HATLI|nr:DivIVA domain-containing protein [Hathewaya limosa]MDQ0480869.1 cell division initiation protein [Hathewaya limosa]
MRITSMDIDSKEFKKVFRGYDIDEVNDFLNEIADDYEELYKENSTLKEKLSGYEEKVEHYRKIEETIQNTLVLAQGAAEQAKISAQKEADIIIQNANDSGQRILDKANNDVLRINDEYERIKQEFEKFRAVFRNFMNSQMDMFQRLEMDFDGNYDIGKGLQELKIDAVVRNQSVPIKQEQKIEQLQDDTNELDKKTISVQASLNDFISRNNIDISKIQNTTSEVEMLVDNK